MIKNSALLKDFLWGMVSKIIVCLMVLLLGIALEVPFSPTASAAPAVQPQSNPVAQTQKGNYARNEPIVVEYSGFPGNRYEWITIVPVNTADNDYDEWYYTKGNQGSLTFKGFPAGDYEVRSYFAFRAVEVKTRSSFTVSNEGPCWERSKANLIDFNSAEPLNAAPNPISSDGVTVSFEGLKVMATDVSQGGFGGQAGPNQVIDSDRTNFNGRFLTEPGNRAILRRSNYRRTINFSEPVNNVCLFVADIDSGQGINLNVLNSNGESLSSGSFPSSINSDSTLTVFDLSELEGIKTISMVGNDPVGIDNLSFKPITPEKPEPPVVIEPEPEPEPEPEVCDPNEPIPGAFSAIRIGDLDGFGFGDGKGLTAANSKSVNVDGKGILSTGDFLPDFNGDAKFSNRNGGDPFDNRSNAEANGNVLTGDGYEDMGSTGSDYTDLFLGKAFSKLKSDRPFPDDDPNTLPNQPGFKFRFKVAKDKLPEGTPLFLNTMLGDYDVEPTQVILTKANGKSVTKELKVAEKGETDGSIQASYIKLDFNQVFSDGDANGEPGYWVGSLDVDFDAPNEPATSFDFTEIGTKKILLKPCS